MAPPFCWSESPFQRSALKTCYRLGPWTFRVPVLPPRSLPPNTPPPQHTKKPTNNTPPQCSFVIVISSACPPLALPFDRRLFFLSLYSRRGCGLRGCLETPVFFSMFFLIVFFTCCATVLFPAYGHLLCLPLTCSPPGPAKFFFPVFSDSSIARFYLYESRSFPVLFLLAWTSLPSMPWRHPSRLFRTFRCSPLAPFVSSYSPSSTCFCLVVGSFSQILQFGWCNSP